MTEPEKVLMPRYRCTHCRRSWANRSTALEHSKRCWFDPANRACKTCTHFRRGFSESDTGYEAADRCAVGRQFPTQVNRFGTHGRTLHVDCDGHRVRADYVNPDVLDAIDEAADGLIP